MKANNTQFNEIFLSFLMFLLTLPTSNGKSMDNSDV